jgi:isoprenylcysteine carboxyl methyltransferase (ICMT) family protein YpbQ
MVAIVTAGRVWSLTLSNSVSSATSEEGGEDFGKDHFLMHAHSK